MKQTFITLALLLLITGIIGFGVSCKKSKNVVDQNTNTLIGTIEGKIVLPAGANFDVNSLIVHSPINSSYVQNGRYAVRGFVNTCNTTIASLSNGNVMMMGYNIPGNSDSIISSKTTALALVMNTPIALYLTKEGKQQLAAKVQSDPNFNSLEEAVRKNIAASKDLLDSTNTELFQKVGDLIESVKNRRTTGTSAHPVPFTQSGRTLTFKNDGRITYSTVIGIYKDGQRVKKIAIEGVPLFPGSVQDVLNNNFRASGITKQESYTLDGDGKFEIKMRTGLVGQSDGTPEYYEALFLNIQKGVIDPLEAFLPIDRTKTNCFLNTTNDVYNAVKDVKGINYKTALLYAAEVTLNSAKDITQCVVGDLSDFDQPFFKSIEKLEHILEKVLLPANAANTTLFGIQWSLTNPSFDTCYKVSGSDIKECGDYKIGDHALGGIVAYILQTGDPGYDTKVQHGLVVAENDLGPAPWGCMGILLGTTLTSIGAGAANTDHIVQSCGANTAADICSTLKLNGYEDWYLPSRDEINSIYANKALIGGFLNGRTYWTSSETSTGDLAYDSGGAWVIEGSGSKAHFGDIRTTSYFVRPLRSF